MIYPSFTIGTKKLEGISAGEAVLGATGMNPPRLNPGTMAKVVKLGLSDRDLEKFFEVCLRAAYEDGMEYAYADVAADEDEDGTRPG